ncbi:hypothetical protein BO219_14375 [Anoxybacillus kestanbolensis]|uniref:Integral membrane protein n=2 Tax=Anoxybacillus TaxID=150247 RepID=M8D4B4_9BACL|nr:MULTISPECIES: hypothetical protein [Bacillaceae]EMT45687.1 hypothetical protein H919_08575 [Anoxybacillus flavithermus AK1]OOD99578.1 hypothetical protein BO219_14375 [Anoxybacillus kestanbolensis]QIZ68893.1 hypothetical protein HF500_17815 [Geobacillus subterraneus]WPZ18004.1 hypothetical protein UM396_15750 [Geobacillus subterraneus]
MDYYIGMSFIILLLILGGSYYVYKGIKYSSKERDLDQRKGGYVVAGNGWLDEFIRYVMPFMPVWFGKIFYMVFGFIIIIMGVCFLYFFVTDLLATL